MATAGFGIDGANGCGKRLGCKRKAMSIQTTPSAALTVLALAAGYLVAGRLALEFLVCLGFLGLSNHVLLTLAAFASVGFVACGLALTQWHPTAATGQMLVDRVLNTRSNWETDTLRSFCEVGIWLGVIWSTYGASSGGLWGSAAALTCGTIAGCLLAVAGEVLKAPLRDLERFLREPSLRSDWSCPEGSGGDEMPLDSGSMMLLMLFGYSAISTIYENVTDVVVACGLAVLGGLSILTVAKVIQIWEPTRRVGATLQARIVCTGENWRLHPLRSALESMFFAGVVIGGYTLRGDALCALQVGTLSSIAVVLVGELLAHGVGVPGLRAAWAAREELVAPLGLLLGSVLLAAAVAEDVPGRAAGLTVANCVAWVSLAGLCRRWRSAWGDAMEDRAARIASNWAELPVRSLAETLAWLLAQWASYAATGSVVAAAVAGSGAALCAMLSSEALGWGHSRNQREAPSSAGASKQSGDRAASAVPSQQSLSWADVSLHNSCDSAWLVIDGGVYDVTQWAPEHPGGSVIYKFAGADATDQFAAFHRPRVSKRLRRFLIGRVAAQADGCAAPDKPSAATLEYRALRERLWQEGYFRPRRSYYAGKAALWLALLTAAVLAVLWLPRSAFWGRTVGAGLLLGLAWQQVAFMTHDAAHYGVAEPASGGGFNALAWLLGSPIFGISTSMWNEEHSLHHAITLRPREDPQFNYLPIFLISPKELEVPPGVEHLARWLVPVQHLSFLPIAVLVGRFNFYLISLAHAAKLLATAPTARGRLDGLMDLLGMLAFWLWLGPLVAQLEGLGAKLLFVGASHFTIGGLHVQLLLSHLATESFTMEEERAEQFFSFQVKASRNIDSAWYSHWFHGGLELQIEHHLFPQLPRHNLKAVQPFVQDICRRHNIPYCSTGFFKALALVMRDLRKLSQEIVSFKMN